MTGTRATWRQTLCGYVALAALCAGVAASASASVGGIANTLNGASSAISPNAASNATTAPSIAAPAAATLARAWSNLWWTRDQQGERLLQSDQPGEAAQRFSDPRRQAYAALRAGQYAQAAKLLAPFRDARSEYNRGNALARTGRLQEALDAYDAALARAPDDHDARHNRDLVARALRQSAQQHGQQGQQGQQGQRGDAHQQGGSQRGQQGGNNEQQRGSGQQRSGGQLAGGAQPPSGSGGQPQANGAQAAGNQSQSQSNIARAQSRSSPGQNGGAQAHASGRLAQAAAPPPATVALARQGAANAADANGPSNALQALATPRAPTGPSAKPESEQALSLEQWLRQIPDDPGGLLRRKFLIEHLMRQRSADP